MPIREYVCAECGHRIERLQKLADAPLTDCPSCGEAALTRKISAVGFRLSGGGWYETDFKADQRRNLAGNEADNKSDTSGASESGETKSADSGSETKPATADKSSDSKNPHAGHEPHTGKGTSKDGKRGAGSSGESRTGAKPAASKSTDSA